MDMSEKCRPLAQNSHVSDVNRDIIIVSVHCHSVQLVMPANLMYNAILRYDGSC